jgi:predicted transcriptional regulator
MSNDLEERHSERHALWQLAILEDDDSPGLAKHLEACQECAALVERLRILRSLAREMPVPPVPIDALIEVLQVQIPSDLANGKRRRQRMRPRGLQRALRLLGPLEARIMREIWSGNVKMPFVVWDVQARMPELAYTTVMTTVVRLAEKGLLDAKRTPGQRAVSYQVAGTPEDFLGWSSREDVDELVRLYGDAAFDAFSERLNRLARDRNRRRVGMDRDGRHA